MGWFVALSLLLHLVFLLGMQREQEPVLLPAAQTQTAALALHLRQPEAAATTKPAPHTTQPRKTVTTPEPARHGSVYQAQQTTEQQPEPQQAQNQMPVTKPAPVTARAHPDSTDQLENLRVTLRRELTNHFSYPQLARRRGWQGEVILAFRLEVDGTIINARVARSSGYGVLDRAALNSLGKVKRINQTLPQEQDMQLPVIYRLQES